MTFTKFAIVLIFCSCYTFSYGQDDDSEAGASENASEIDEIQPVADNPDSQGIQNAFLIQPDSDDEITGETVTDAQAEADQSVYDLGLEYPAEQDAEEEITLDLFESRTTYRSYMDVKQYPEAVAMATHALKLSEQEYGRESAELIPVLDELGLALLFARQPEIAIQHFERSVTLIEDNKGIFSADLVDPITGMGLAMQQMENHSGAINHFLRSQHVIHRNRGVTDLSQTNVMQMLTRSLLMEERLSDAEYVQEAILKIHKMNYGADSGRIARPMIELANWQRRYGLLNDSRALYRSSIQLRLEYLDAESIAMKPVLEKLGLRYFDVMAPSWMQGYQFSDDIIDALTIHRESLSLEDRILSYLAVADQLILFGDSKQAQAAYAKVWSLASSDQNSDTYWGRFFDNLTVLNDGAGMDLAKMKDIDADELAFATFSFSVNKNGQPTNIKVEESNLEKKSWKLAKRNFRRARFRPDIRGGRAQESNRLTWRRVFPRGQQIDPAREQNAYAWLMTHSSYSHLTR